MKTPPANPVQRYRQAMKDCQSLLAEITTKVNELEKKDSINWGTVGDANRLRHELGHLADMLCERGEYAPENRG